MGFNITASKKMVTTMVAIFLAVVLMFTAVSLSPVDTTPGLTPDASLVSYAGADKVCRNTHHHHFKTVDSVVREVHWYAKVTQSGPNQLKYSWYSGLKAHENGGTYQGYKLC